MNSALQNAAIEQPQHSTTSFQKSAIAQAAGLPFIFMSKADVLAVCCMSRSTMYERIAEGSFPSGLLLSEKCRRWKSTDIAAWLEAQVALAAEREATSERALKRLAKKAAKSSGDRSHG